MSERSTVLKMPAYRLTSPGLGKEVGATLRVNQAFYQGLFLAPTVTASALKGAIFAANIYESLGFPVVPNGSESRHDIIQAVTFGKPEGVIAFCEGIQAAAPVDSYVTPEPWAMPGYDSDVIMAAGAFVQGSSIELSADGPIKPPYAVYFQGGLTYPHAKAWNSHVSGKTGGGRYCNTSGIRKTGGKRMEVCVIGAGAAGLMAAVAAAKSGAAVTVLEAMDKPGKKISITGNGRCNLTNRGIQNAAPYFSDAPETADSILRGFPAEDTVHFYENLGLLMKEREGGLIYPYSDQAQSVVNALLQEVRRRKIKLKMPGTGGFH